MVRKVGRPLVLDGLSSEQLWEIYNKYGNLRDAAKSLGVSPNTFRARMVDKGLPRKECLWVVPIKISKDV